MKLIKFFSFIFLVVFLSESILSLSLLLKKNQLFEVQLVEEIENDSKEDDDKFDDDLIKDFEHFVFGINILLFSKKILNFVSQNQYNYLSISNISKPPCW
ncbi:MAG TPA: hypothetical protein PK995_10135 [Bacteroidia bacterium]|nr:hypothetical protein [Bacteroidia bacterium]